MPRLSAERDARLQRDDDGREPPALQARAQGLEQRHGVARGCEGGKAVRHDEDDIDGIGREPGFCGFQRGAARGGELAAVVGAHEVFAAIACGTVRVEHGKSRPDELRLDSGGIHRHVNGVARLRMGETELEHGLRGLAVARAAERDARGGEFSETLPGVDLDRVRFFDDLEVHAASESVFACRSKGWPAGRRRRRPAASVICMRSSHSSNSGARRSESARRT
jgi:hypothetical protein